MANTQEIRAKATASTFLQVRFNIHLEREENLWKFEEDLNLLWISKGDYLIAVQVGGKHIDIRNKEADDVNKIIMDALKERNTLQCPVTPCHPWHSLPYHLAHTLQCPGTPWQLAASGTPWHPWHTLAPPSTPGTSLSSFLHALALSYHYRMLKFVLFT